MLGFGSRCKAFVSNCNRFVKRLHAFVRNLHRFVRDLHGSGRRFVYGLKLKLITPVIFFAFPDFIVGTKRARFAESTAAANNSLGPETASAAVTSPCSLIVI